MKKILLVGNGAREHVIAETLKKSPKNVSLVTYGKTVNPGIQALSDLYELGNLTDLKHIKEFATSQNVDFAVVGPEDPIVAGAADELAMVNIPTVAPKKTCARLESSKGFTRDLLAKYNIPGNPLFRIFMTPDGLENFVKQVNENFVVKADGLMAGKGVKVSGDHFSTTEEGLDYAQKCLVEDGRVVLEEKLIGQEFSLMSFCDGKHAVHMPAVQDHKRAYEDDRGPNTGGMGTYSDADHSLPFLYPSDLETAEKMNQQVLDAVCKETGTPFIGILYGGFMAVKNGVRLIEYNARFGDPEAMNVLSLLETDFVSICEAMISGHLDKIPISFAKKATVCKYLVPQGYPDNAVKDVKVGLGPVSDNVRVHFGSVDQKGSDLFLCGSRAIAVTGISESLEVAERYSEIATESVRGPVFHRRDIGTKRLIDARIEMMKKLRNR